MGWYVRTTPLPHFVTPDAYLRGEVSHDDGAGNSLRVIDSAFVGSTWYAAAEVRRVARDGAAAADFVTALVYLTSGGRARFGYKPMDESMGPNECRCPVRILARLTPVEALPGAGYAADWRARCAAWRVEAATARDKARLLVPGAVVRLPEPVRFRSGATVQEFRVCAPMPGRRGVILAAADGRGGLYRLPGSVLATAEVVT